MSNVKPKVFIGIGHGGKDPGAVKYLREADVNLIMGLACGEYLSLNGVEVKYSRTKDENDPVSEEVKECNAFDPDLAVDVHNNAGGGDGFEVLHTIGGGVGKTLAQNIEAEVKKLGQNSRGLKTRKNSNGSDYYAFIRCTKCPAVILEGVFVDNATDIKIADTVAEQKAFGVAYAKGILKTLGKSETVKPATSGEMYRVRKSWADALSQIGAYTVLENAKKKADGNPGYEVYNSAGVCVYAPNKSDDSFKVKVSISDLNIRTGAGTNYARVQYIEPGVYTIVEVKAGKGSVKGWGKLKSGAGWISLDYATRL